ncbi:serine hydrolase domain-containing protein [Nonomuraea basaltis]|uniref:serine hydrolase domain-containing protein n=1 Tax=Nonomuraea basaltis TaxID=2495887 RepID=UPI00110C6F0D|nr:serine hydrolase domain-containing protein [Nonomuraea basaltis]TMR88883.1 beta-lactamase family protein [Nonomuraea basaltis]
MTTLGPKTFRSRTTRAGIGLLTAAAVACVAMAAPATAVSSGPTSDRPRVQQALERAVTETGLPGILAKVREGDDQWFGTAGVADTRTGRKRLPQERFRIGSATKTFTATVVLQLEAEGKLSLDDTVEEWLPGLVRGNGHDGRQITIKQLLSMTSGIFNYLLDEEIQARIAGPAFLEHRYDSYRPQQLVKIAMSHAPDFKPGQGWTYTNTGFVLAAMIVEKATGKTYAEQVSQRIIRPLGLTGTYVPGGKEVRIRGPHARHYSTLLSQEPKPTIYDVTELNASAGWAAGNMVSTAADLDRFFTTLLKGRLLPKAQQRQMFATIPVPEGKWIPNTTYGLGMSSVKLSCGTTVWGMGGAIHGSWSYAYGTRDATRMLVQNVNGDWNNPIATVFTPVLEAEFCAPRSR